MPDYMPDKDRDIHAWIANFLGVATGNLAALGLTSADLTNLNGVSSNFAIGLETITDLRAQLEGAVLDKDSLRKGAESDVRTLVKRIQAHPGVSDSLKGQLGINTNNGSRNRTPPVQTANLLATPQEDGTNALKWHKMGNKATTQFVVYAKPLTNGASIAAEAGWTMVGQTTKTNFAHQGVTPGVPMAYKVQAARAGNISVPSLPATVYVS